MKNHTRFRFVIIVNAILVVLTMGFLNSCENDLILDSSVSGMVIDDETGEALTGVIVTITPGNSNDITDESGHFIFEGLYPQKYTLQFQKNGYHTNRKNIILTTGETADFVMPLTRIP